MGIGDLGHPSLDTRGLDIRTWVLTIARLFCGLANFLIVFVVLVIVEARAKNILTGREKYLGALTSLRERERILANGDSLSK